MVVVVRRGKIAVSVYPETGGRHNDAHCHIWWPDGKCSVTLDGFKLLAGKLPPSAALKILAEYESELLRVWEELNG